MKNKQDQQNKYDRVVFDVDTQNDFMQSKGALSVVMADKLIPKTKELVRWAFENNIPVIGSVDRHFGTKEYADVELELARNGGPFPNHCMDGSPGQEKVNKNAFDAMYFVEARADPAEVAKVVEAYKSDPRKVGLFFEKQTYDVANNPFFKKAIKYLGVKESVVFGVATDYCVKAAVNALTQDELGVKVYVIKDAIAAVTPEGEKEAIEEMKLKGAEFVESNKFDFVNWRKI